jgi:hypothetical protein
MCHTNPIHLLEIAVKPGSHILCKRKVSARRGRLPETLVHWSILGVFVFLQGLDLSVVSYGIHAGECRYVGVWNYFPPAPEPSEGREMSQGPEQPGVTPLRDRATDELQYTPWGG